MKRNSLTVLVGAVLVVIFALLLFSFQVRQTETALVTTFDRPTRYETEPGFKWKWPPPIQRVYKFDKRVQTFDQDKIDQTLTQDALNLDIQVYVGWTITNASVFFSSFPAGTAVAAHPTLESLIRGAKSQVVGNHPFSHFVSTDTNELKFAQIEQEMLQRVQATAPKYGIDVRFLGIKKLALPESVTQRVFERMQKERQRQVDTLVAIGESKAKEIRSAAERQSNNIIAQANYDATIIRGAADAESSKSFAVFEQNPDLALFINKLRAIEEAGKQNATYFLDTRTPPFDLLGTNFWLRSSPSQPPNTVSGLPNGVIEATNVISRNSP
jgi:modulator of FtsH protease HflC